MTTFIEELDDILAPLPFEELRVSLPDGSSYITTTADDARQRILNLVSERIIGENVGTPLVDQIIDAQRKRLYEGIEKSKS